MLPKSLHSITFGMLFIQPVYLPDSLQHVFYNRRRLRIENNKLIPIDLQEVLLRASEQHMRYNIWNMGQPTSYAS